jgi:PAS domain-containing protein
VGHSGSAEAANGSVSREQEIEDYEVEHEFPKLGRRTMLLNGQRVELRDGKEPLLLLGSRTVTERKRAEETLRTHAEEISRLARGMLGRELRIIDMKMESMNAAIDWARWGVIHSSSNRTEKKGLTRRDRGINHEFL